jgi:glutamine amidotransferase
MDETLASVALDLSGRPFLIYHVNLPKVKIGEFDVELAREFFQALVNNLGANIHINVMYGDNVHHILEACFKATARALDLATQLDPRIEGVMSTCNGASWKVSSHVLHFTAHRTFMIAIIDYGMGNLRSVQKGFEKVGFEAVVTADPRQVLEADRVVLPGVGAFRDCMRSLETGGFIEPILKVIESGRPFLGICLGLQLLFTESEEFGLHKGLGIISGRVVRFPEGMRENGEKLAVPHMGWNQIAFRQRPAVFADIDEGTNVYFVHSYYVKPEDQVVIATTTGYGSEFCSSICLDNVVATQFHPEKSQEVGLRILKNFGDMS